MVNIMQGRNADVLRTQSFYPRTSSASALFKTDPAEIAEHGYVLTPGRTACAEEVKDYGVPFAEEMDGLTREFATQFQESRKLQAAFRDNMQKLGFALPEVGE